jgi:hypothetical protein
MFMKRAILVVCLTCFFYMHAAVQPPGAAKGIAPCLDEETALLREGSRGQSVAGIVYLAKNLGLIQRKLSWQQKLCHALKTYEEALIFAGDASMLGAATWIWFYIEDKDKNTVLLPALIVATAIWALATAARNLGSYFANETYILGHYLDSFLAKWEIDHKQYTPADFHLMFDHLFKQKQVNKSYLKDEDNQLIITQLYTKLREQYVTFLTENGVIESHA